jgi:hypothetical protein
MRDSSYTQRLKATCPDYLPISEAPGSVDRLLEKYGRRVPNMKNVAPEAKAGVSEQLKKDIIECVQLERKEKYSSTDGTSVYLIQNPLVWRRSETTRYRPKPEFYSALSASQNKQKNTKTEDYF